MVKDRKQDRHLIRVTRQNMPFCGVDGEGGEIDGSHEYLLLRAGTRVLETGDPLRYEVVLPWLADLPKDRIYVSFFFDYDVTMILRRMPVERVKRLLDTDCRRIPGKPCSSWPIDIGPFQVDYMPHKEFRVRRTDREDKRWTVIHDTGTFFQSSFVAALEKWFPEDEFRAVIEKIREGKAQRHDFGELTEYEREYNRLEIVMLEHLMERFREMCERLELRPRKWQGPGNLVSCVFQREKLPKNKDLTLVETHPELMRMANDAYYGGRFEPCYFGDIPGPIYQADINSAYARTYASLPCLVHGRWERISRLPVAVPESKKRGASYISRSTELYISDVSFKHKPAMALGTLPIRTNKGSLIFPLQGRGTYWSTELDVAREHGVKLICHGGWKYTKMCDCQHFDFVERLYDERRRLGKDAAGRVLKLVLASTYGKLAQSVGCAPYSNPIWAGLIVSQVRAQLIGAALQVDGGRDVLMLATDGLFYQTPRTLAEGSELGLWTVEQHDSMFIVQSGVYFLPNQEKTKTRGMSRDFLNSSKLAQYESDFRQSWANFLCGKSGVPESVGIEWRNFVGLRLAAHRNKLDRAGQWEDLTGENAKRIGFDWSTKRTRPEVVGTYVRTHPIQGSPRLSSEPYSRTIGGLRFAERLVIADQPDWGDQL